MDVNIGSLLTPEILLALDSLWPDRCPSPSLDDRKMIIACAQREVINTLHAKYAQAQTHSPDSKVL